MNKKEEDGIRVYGSAEEIGRAIYQLLTKGNLGKTEEVKE